MADPIGEDEPRGRSILFVTQLSPPASFSAGRRIGGLTKYLSRLGHQVTVLTSVASGEGSIEGAARVIRTPDLIMTGLNWRRAHFLSLKEGGAGYRGGPSRVAYALVPDLALVSWVPFALTRALRLAARERFDCVITTSPPESGHFVGAALRRSGIPWIADFRDGWTFETTHPHWPLRSQHRLDEALESAVVRRADRVVGVSEPITEDLRRRLGGRAVTISNGFDPDEVIVDGPPPVELAPDRHSLVHTGRMAFAGRSALPLLDAIRLLATSDSETMRRLEVIFAGPLSGEEHALIADPRLAGTVRAVGTLDRSATLRLQRAANSLLLITGRERRSEATAKLYEYLAAERPIVTLGQDSAAAGIVEELGAGITTSATDPQAIASTLKRVVADGAAGGAHGGGSYARFSYEVLARRLAAEIEAIAR